MEKNKGKKLKELRVVASGERNRDMGKGLLYFATSLVALFFKTKHTYYFYNNSWNTHKLLIKCKMMQPLTLKKLNRVTV